MKHLLSHSSSLLVSHMTLTMSLFRVLAVHVGPFYSQLVHFIVMSVFGFLGLKTLKPRLPLSLSNFDLFFTSVSSVTVSSVTAVEMEVFSNSQLLLMTFLIFVGGRSSHPSAILSSSLERFIREFLKKNELGVDDRSSDNKIVQDDNKLGELKRRSVKCLGFVTLGSTLVLHLVGSSLVLSYISIEPSARQVLRKKGISVQTFSVFTIVSTIASCGFVPTNENMIVFKQNSGLLWLILPFVYIGNTLYAPFLRLVIWVLDKVMKREEFGYIQKNYKEIGFDHLLSGVHCWLLVATVLGFNLIQFVLFCCLEWNSENMEGLNTYQKLIASLFQITNARYAGQTVFDLSALSSAILVLFVVMILKEDPLNFNVFNITLEVISAYGNVGFSTGYSCKRQLKADANCRDLWIGLSGKMSNKGKFIIIVVMFFGRLKKYNMKGGQAWDLS
ncbi:hypothetical protein K1719_038122 [Acacia pycnantha]|nr:hypothetical protein K1719_038122 [Acacia pycnantha]